jgi:hypothetical protein
MVDVFNRFSAPEDNLAFSRTHVVVALARYGDENLVSRSQARGLLARFDRFKEVILDFRGIDSIGQAFADEIFRVFQNAYPHLRLVPLNTVPIVLKMIERVKNPT